MRAVVLLSGGMDSTVTLYEALWTHGGNVCALGIDYGQRHAREELTRAESIAVMADVAYEVARIDLGAFSALVNRDDDAIITDPRDAVVPFRNSFFALRAATHALARGAIEIWMGCCAADAAAFPDCRPEWATAMSALLDVAGGHGIRLVTPVIDRTKSQIITRARALGCIAAVEASWSCYCPTTERKPCGQCSACWARERGFAEEAACSR